MKQAILKGNSTGSVSQPFSRRRTNGVRQYSFTGVSPPPWYGSVQRWVMVCTLMRVICLLNLPLWMKEKDENEISASG